MDKLSAKFSNAVYKNIKLFLDIIMSILLVLLMKTRFTGIELHELTGLFVFFLFVIHKVLNFSWIKAVILNYGSGKIKTKTKVMLFLDIILFAFVTFIIISGIFISQTILTEITVENIMLWSELHHFSSYCALILISVHIGLHWQMIMNAFKRMFGLNDLSKFRTAVSRVLSIVIIIMGIKVMINPSTIENFTAPFKFDEGNQNITQISKVSSKDSAYNITFLNTNSLEVDEIPSLEDFLSNLICKGCSKRCPLLALRCSKGIKYREAAIEEYNATYANAILNAESSTSESSSSESSTSESSTSESNESETESTRNDNSSVENTTTEVESGAADNSILESSTSNSDTDKSESTQESVTSKNSDTNKSIPKSTSKSATKSTITNESNEIEPERKTPESNINEPESNAPNLLSDKENVITEDRFSEFSLSDNLVEEESQSDSSPMDFVSIMGLFIAGTHYTIKSSEKKKT